VTRDEKLWTFQKCCLEPLDLLRSTRENGCGDYSGACRVSLTLGRFVQSPQKCAGVSTLGDGSAVRAFERRLDLSLLSYEPPESGSLILALEEREQGCAEERPRAGGGGLVGHGVVPATATGTNGR